MKKLLVILAVCCMFAMVASGGEKKRLRVGFSESSFDGAWRMAEVEDLRKAAEKYGHEIIITNANSDIEKQLADVEDLLAQNIDMLIIVPVDADAVAPAFAAAKAKNVPVIDLDTEFLSGAWPDDFITVIRSDQYAQGKGCADWLIADAAGKDVKVLEITGNPGQSDAQNRSAGFSETVAPHKNIDLFSVQNGRWARSTAQEIVQNAIQSSNGDFNYVYCHNDEMALGVVMVVKQAALKPRSDIKICAIDGMFEALDSVKDGEINAIITCSPKGGDLVFDVIEKYFNGDKLDKTYFVHQSTITPDNVEELYAVEGF